MTRVDRQEGDGDGRGRRPAGVSDEVVEAVGKASEAAEYLIRARGALYEFHQLMGRADLLMGDAADALREAGCEAQAEALRTEVVGRNVLDGRWTFQIVEEFDGLYYDPVQSRVRAIEDELLAGQRHVFESEMKEERRTAGRPGHERRPPAAWSQQVEVASGDPDAARGPASRAAGS